MKKLPALLTLAASFSGVVFAAPDEKNVTVPLAFQPLKPGAVEPAGWLRDWAVDAKNGITGHLDERAATFELGWSGKEFKASGAKEKGTGWPLEQCAYWLDGL